MNLNEERQFIGCIRISCIRREFRYQRKKFEMKKINKFGSIHAPIIIICPPSIDLFITWSHTTQPRQRRHYNNINSSM